MSSRKDADFDGLYEKVPEWVYGIIERRNELYDAIIYAVVRSSMSFGDHLFLSQ